MGKKENVFFGDTKNQLLKNNTNKPENNKEDIKSIKQLLAKIKAAKKTNS